MDEYESSSHSKWECKYHIVFIPKCQRKVLYGNLRGHVGDVFRKLAEQKQNYAEPSFWSRGYFVQTVGRDEATVRDYIRNQEQEDKIRSRKTSGWTN